MSIRRRVQTADYGDSSGRILALKLPLLFDGWYLLELLLQVVNYIVTRPSYGKRDKAWHDAYCIKLGS